MYAAPVQHPLPVTAKPPQVFFFDKGNNFVDFLPLLKGCCCFTAETGSIILAIITIIIFLFRIIFNVIMFVDPELYLETWQIKDAKVNYLMLALTCDDFSLYKSDVKHVIMPIFDSVVALSVLSISILLLIGIFKEEPMLILCYIYGSYVIYAIYAAVPFVFIFLLSFEISPLFLGLPFIIFFIILTVFWAYEVLVVNSHLQDIIGY